MKDRWYDNDHNDDTVTIETLIDKTSLTEVLYALRTICDGKAEHLESAWQDKSAAKQWSNLARAIEKLADKSGQCVG